MAKVNSGTMTVTVFAALVGLGGAFVVRQTMQPPAPVEMPAPAATPAPVIVPLAATDLQPGRKLVLNDIAPRRLSHEEFQKSEFRKITFLSVAAQIQGRTLRKAVPTGRPFQPDDFYPDGAGPDISERLQAGYRAVTVAIESVGSINGFAVPGSIVDVLFRAKAEGVRPAVTLTLLERVEVLALNVNTVQGMRDQSTTPAAATTVTVAVTPQQAKILKVVEGRGDLSLTLRNPNDDFQFAPVEVGGGMRPDLRKQTAQVEPIPEEQLRTIPSRHATKNTAKTPSTTPPPSSPLTRARTTTRSRWLWPEPLAKADRHLADDRVVRGIGNASERLTLDDLLGIEPTPKKRVLEIFLGPQRTVINFDDFTQNSNSNSNSDARIRTPITGSQPAGSNVNTTQTQPSR